MSPWLAICSAISNCCLTMAAMPGFDARLMTERILVPNTPSLTARAKQLVEVRDRLHEADAILLVGQALVDLDDGNDATVFPQIGRDRLALRLAVHRALEQDRRDHLVAGKGRRGDDADAHLVHEPEHLGVFAFVGALRIP